MKDQKKEADLAWKQILGTLRQKLSLQSVDCPEGGAISAYAAGKLAETDRRSLELHLAFCRRCLHRFRRARLLGFILSDSAAAMQSVGEWAVERMREIADTVRIASADWQPAVVRVHGAPVNVPVKAVLMGDSIQPSGKYVDLLMSGEPSISEDGRLTAGFMLQDEAFSGMAITMTLAQEGDSLATVTGLLEAPGRITMLEGDFPVGGSEFRPSFIPLDQIVIRVWSEDNTE